MEMRLGKKRNRLGPRRLHHGMRQIGAAERGMQLMVQRSLQRRTFGKFIAQHGSFVSDLAKCRTELEKTTLLVFEAADPLDRFGNKKARGALAMAKAMPALSSLISKKDQDVAESAGVRSLRSVALLGAGLSGILSFTTVAYADEAEHGLECAS